MKASRSRPPRNDRLFDNDSGGVAAGNGRCGKVMESEATVPLHMQEFRDAPREEMKFTASNAHEHDPDEERERGWVEAPGVEAECAGQVTDMELETGGRQRNRSGIAGRAER
jgi:hypothetical protein